MTKFSFYLIMATIIVCSPIAYAEETKQPVLTEPLKGKISQMEPLSGRVEESDYGMQFELYQMPSSPSQKKEIRKCLKQALARLTSNTSYKGNN